MSKLLKRFLSYFPTRLPVGMTEMNKWLNDITELTGPIANERDMHFVLCSILIHAPANNGYMKKNYFVNQLIKSAANQVASQIFQTIKMQQAEEMEAAKKAAELEQNKVAVTAQNESAMTDGAAQKALN